AALEPEIKAGLKEGMRMIKLIEVGQLGAAGSANERQVLINWKLSEESVSLSPSHRGSVLLP
ncbi:MAG: hypothetical protein Q7U02_07005, partial [Desulfosalsimonadaceae bacterium]|nr:hypothetical protein [Desulfosalsimonadaceae bacterium]